jgi:hypothetical protein
MAETYASAEVRGIGPMGKAMSIAGMVIGGILTLVFALDLILKIPFGGRQPMMDIGFAVCSLILVYLSWNAFRDAS